jgi:hypothetical protein
MLNTIRDFFSGGITGGRPMAHPPDSDADHALITGLPESLKRDTEVARLGKTLTQWRSEFLGYFDTDGASNGGTEAMNGLIELHRRIARGFRNRDNYRLRMLLIGGGLICRDAAKSARCCAAHFAGIGSCGGVVQCPCVALRRGLR